MAISRLRHTAAFALPVLLAGVGVACATYSTAQPAQPAPNSELHPLAARQATVQAQLAPALQEAQEAAAAAVSARATAAAAATPTPPLPPSPTPSWPTPRSAATPIPVPTIPPPPSNPIAADQDVIARASRVVSDTGHPTLRELAETVSQRGVTVYFAPLPRGVGAVWQPPRNAIAISDDYRKSSVQGIAGILVHEATHAYDHYRGRDSGSTTDCYDLEGRAFANQARLWEALYGRGGKTGALDSLDQQMNRILFVVNEKPLSFAVELLSLYKHQCA